MEDLFQGVGGVVGFVGFCIGVGRAVVVGRGLVEIVVRFFDCVCVGLEGLIGT